MLVNLLLNILAKGGLFLFFSLDGFLGTLKNSDSSSEPLSTSQELQNICNTLSYNLPNLAFITTSFPLACVWLVYSFLFRKQPGIPIFQGS